MGKMKQIFTQWRVIILLLFIVFAIFAIQPQFSSEGVAIRSVDFNSSAANAGIENPSAKITPVAKERILSVNGKVINSLIEYSNIVDSLPVNKTVKVETNQQIYTLIILYSEDGRVDLGIKVVEAATSNLRKGLDLEGGTRVLLQPAEQLSKEDLNTVVDTLKERLNVYGLGDVLVTSASDLAGQDFILVEIAGATEQEVKDLLSKQCKFEAKIGNQSVFVGGKQDITYICRSATCAGIDPQRACTRSSEGGYNCGFFFQITLSPEAADRQASITKDSKIIPGQGGSYLDQELVLYLDDKEVDRLKIGAELKGKSSTDIQISGSGQGRTEQEAVTITLQNMKKLQTVLITGSLPVKLEVVKMDTVSPTLGKAFLNNVLLVGALALLSVVSVVLIRYRKVKIIIPMTLALMSEMVMILGFASLVKWNLDLAAIAGLIIVAGTGVNHLIVITDETLRGEAAAIDWKQRIKNALFIIMGAYFTNMGSLIPLFWAGAGLLKGFALTTIAGMSVGVLIARPAYAAVIEILLKD